MPSRFATWPSCAGWLMAVLAVLVAGATGCAGRRHPGPATAALDTAVTAELAARAEAVRRDPLGYLRRVADKCSALQQYTLTFTRQERRGLGWFKSLRPPEHIACRFRRHPFSIYMKWLDPTVKYGESTYVEGQAGNRVRFVPRHGLFGLPPKVTRVDLMTPVIWGEARYPLTDFGLERMMERTFDSIRRAGDEAVISYRGLTRLAGSSRIVHYLRLEFPSWLSPTPVQELYIDARSDLPACTRILSTSGRLEAAYYWDQIDPNVTLTDEDFLLQAERGRSETPRGPASDPGGLD